MNWIERKHARANFPMNRQNVQSYSLRGDVKVGVSVGLPSGMLLVTVRCWICRGEAEARKFIRDYPIRWQIVHFLA
jgi:hypothetical protein